ncbi:conserved Plasmodium protein, unknown function [Plasmodium yoelii]|uniref:Fam-c protein n=1 Tax=Plasmodium yoelii TaxID=5861 RepID=A0A4V0KNU0_PLAYE|nr:conserved Plasmodium protein, unknown function [Plasmodium yoelii]VTZ79878.1 conserved Plasmodium protein, unknown function [Plasmodium yoelii]|eukprot:XP_034493568.1 conserved Plasmodium protein, unknown function [Plasmodium yoelii]
MHSYIFKILLFTLFYKIMNFTPNYHEGINFVRGKVEKDDHFNIELSYNGDNKKNKPSSSELYEKYMKEIDDHKHKSVKDVMNNIMSTFDSIDQKMFLNKLSEEVNEYLKLYKSFSI